MSGTMRKMGVYLGLLEDANAEYVDDEAAYDEPARREAGPRGCPRDRAGAA